MRLLLGSKVRERGRRVGSLAGFELESASLAVRRIIVSADGDLGSHALTRPVQAVSSIHDDGEIELGEASIEGIAAVSDVVLVSRATRLRHHGRARGRVVGLDLDASSRRVKALFGRLHWWSPRFEVPATGADLSTPGEIQFDGGTQAA